MKKKLIVLLSLVVLACALIACVACNQPVDDKPAKPSQRAIISFVVDGETYATIDTLGNKVLTLPQIPTKNGYTFDGWYWDKDTWQRPFTEQSFSEVDDDVNIYAKFSPILSTVTFDSNGGSSVDAIQNVTYNSLIEAPSQPTLKDRVFMGWYADNQFNSEWRFESDKVTKDITLYAKWGTPSNLLYEFNPDGESYAVVGINTNDTDIVIPGEYNGKPVTAISGNGGGGAFFYTPITSVFIPDSILNIGSTAFAQCFSLTSVNIPDSVTEIGEGAFSACWSLEEITVDKANSKYHSHGNCIIETETKTLIAGCKTSVIPDDGSVTKIKFAFAYSNVSSVSIPESVTEIGEAAFFSCALTRITIPKGVVSIADNAFDGSFICEVYNKSQLNIVKGADTFGRVAKVAKNVYTPTSGKSNIVDDNGLIFYCDDEGAELLRYEGNATEIVLPQDVNGKEYTTTHLSFIFCSNMQTITIPDFVTELDNFQFNEFDYWPYGNRNIIARETHPLYSSQDGVLYNKDKTEIVSVYSGLESLVIPEGVRVIENGVLWYNYTIDYISIPNSIEEVGQLFYYLDRVSGKLPHCIEYEHGYYLGNEDNPYLVLVAVDDNITTLKLHKDVKILSLQWQGDYIRPGDPEFKYPCDKLESISIADDATFYSSQDGILYNKDKSLIEWIPVCKKNVVIADQVKEIKDFQFAGLQITEILISKSVTSIGSHAFDGCSNLTSITIPNSVTSIGDLAFIGCGALTIYCEAESEPDGWNSNWNGNCSVVWDCNNNKVATDGYMYTVVDGVRYKINGNATVATQSVKITAANIRSFITYDGVDYTVIEIDFYAFQYCTELASVTIPNSVTWIGFGAFDMCISLTSVYYNGTAEEWAKIRINSTGYLTNAARYYYSATEPALNVDGTAYDGNYWYYNEQGKPVIWIYIKEN